MTIIVQSTTQLTAEMTNKRRVLFLCTGNSARSQMAEALLRHKAAEQFDVYSAGTHPDDIDQRTLKALTNFGLATELLYSKNVNDFIEQAFDYVITLCDKASHECRIHPWFYQQGSTQHMAWDFPDPKSREVADPFAVTLNELNSRLSMFLLVESKKQAYKPLLLQANKENSPNELLIDPIAFYKCLTDEIRLKSLMLVKYHGELCVCELMVALQEQSQPKMSRNLALLRKAKVLVDRKHGQWVFYRLNPLLPEWAKSVLAQTTENNVGYIQNSLDRLSEMNDRPDKAKFCC
jgi:ArsR family transcriptional regulator, arsenate/arsenite/antimonite-responsive transcriptional repressor / arsenate reductase (thioredoxin)